MSVIDEIAKERFRQVNAEGYNFAHDDEHDGGSLAVAAGCYALRTEHPDEARELWPWDAEYWKPKDKRRDFIRAAALLVAEIERIDRLNDGDGNE